MKRNVEVTNSYPENLSVLSILVQTKNGRRSVPFTMHPNQRRMRLWHAAGLEVPATI